MGFKIQCPHCGPRAYHEFSFGGEIRPFETDRNEQADYSAVWLRDNVAGAQSERWFHFAGCRRWLTVRRNTSDNTILEVS
jgi:heterotetrameric sarcosine oxidase delta subunit